MSVQVVIVNHIRLYAEGLKNLLEEDERIRVSAIACSGVECEALGDIPADLVITDDMGFCHVAGRDRKVLLIADGSPAPLCVEDLKQMVSAGLAGILPPDTVPDLVRKAVIQVCRGELWIDHRTIRKSLCMNAAPREAVNLSRRESEILHCICSGQSNKEIAENLCISEQTVKTHCNHLYKKFGVSSRLKLALHSLGHGDKHPDNA